jgi:2-oxoglutarate dehydrogenase E1 component
MADMAETADFISNISEEWIEKLHNAWRENPESVSREWQLFFSGFELASAGVISAPSLAPDAAGELKLSAVQSLIYRYRDLGHLLACTDPLSVCQLEHPLLSLSAFDLDQTDLDHVFTTRRFLKKSASLREIIFTLRETYCREIGVEFMHIQDPDERQWLIDRMESSLNRSSFSPDERLQLLENLHEAALFEGFLHRRFIGQKRFSLEGGEVLIPVLDALVKACPAAGIKDVIFGMAHRGRLNVLANVLRKPLENIFAEFKGTMAVGFEGDGDVKYHKGYSTDVELPSG